MAYKPLESQRLATKSFILAEIEERKRFMSNIWSFPAPYLSGLSNQLKHASSNDQCQNQVLTDGLLVAKGGEKRGFEAASAKSDMSLFPKEYQSAMDPKRKRLLGESDADSTMVSETTTNSSQSSVEDHGDSTEDEGLM